MNFKKICPYYLTIRGDEIIINMLLRIGGDYLVARKKPGPKTDKPKDTMLRVRVDKETLAILDSSAKELETTRSDVVRKGIYLVHDGLKK